MSHIPDQGKLPRLARDILAQPESLAIVLRQHSESGLKALQQAASLLQSARRVVITGMGASLFASIPLQYRLGALGIPAILLETGELLHYLRPVCEGAVVVVVSRSGESVEVVRLLESLGEGTPVIGVSNVPDSRLARAATANINVGSLSDEYVAVQTYTGTLLVLHLLAACVSGKIHDARQDVENTLPAFASLVEHSMQRRTDWDSFLSPVHPTYLLARGPSLATANAGALLFHEIAKASAVCMAAASFRHGPVEVVNDSFRALLFAPGDTARDLNLALARDLVRFGAHIRAVGDSQGSPSQLPFIYLPPCDPALAPLFEIVPVQAAALRLAELRGIAPGTFRYAPQVATDEASFGGSADAR